MVQRVGEADKKRIYPLLTEYIINYVVMVGSGGGGTSDNSDGGDSLVPSL